LNNVLNNGAHAAIKQTLINELNAWMAQQGDQGAATELAADDRLIAGGGD
jgi:hypothetical protein